MTPVPTETLHLFWLRFLSYWFSISRFFANVSLRSDFRLGRSGMAHNVRGLAMGWYSLLVKPGTKAENCY